MKNPRHIITDPDWNLAALRLEGFVIVPIEPSEEMIEAAWAAAHNEDAAGVWRDMIDAATK